MQNMSLSLSVHPFTQRKQSHFGSVLSHLKPQRSCTYRGMLSRKQNQNSVTPTRVHFQDGGQKGCPWAHSIIIPKQLWYDGRNSRINISPTFQRQSSATDTPLSPSAVTPLLQEGLGQQHRAGRARNVLPAHCCQRRLLCPTYFFWTGIIVNNYLKHINHQFLRNTRSSGRKDLKAFLAL